jgi:uncharacterized DUF497 family protein
LNVGVFEVGDLKCTQNKMLEWNEEKRLLTLEKRGLDFADSALVFAGETLDIEDTRKDYGECRIVSFGYLDERMMSITWTWRGKNRRIISMRKAHEKEIERYSPFFKR